MQIVLSQSLEVLGYMLGINIYICLEKWKLISQCILGLVFTSYWKEKKRYKSFETQLRYLEH